MIPSVSSTLITYQVEILSEIKNLLHPSVSEEAEERESMMKMSLQAMEKLRVLDSMAAMVRRKMEDDENYNPNYINRQIDMSKMNKALRDIKKQKKKVGRGFILGV